jgi:hypothetical protein
MTTKSISRSEPYASCDVCGRTLLRGEHAEVFLSGATRHAVCDLCSSRALHEGWIREGAVPTYSAGDGGGERRRSLFGRLRGRREPPAVSAKREIELSEPTSPRPPAARAEPQGAERPLREPRHVRAVPTSDEQRIVAAVEMFNSTEHRRTISGVARSLGPPGVSVRPSGSRPSIVDIVVSWELCWYRYEVDLSDELPSVEVAGQGYELDELQPEERTANAVADDRGNLSLG